MQPRRMKYALMYARDLSIPPGGTVWSRLGNTEIVDFTSLWRVLTYIVQTKAARAAVLAGRVRLIKIVPKAGTQEAR